MKILRCLVLAIALLGCQSEKALVEVNETEAMEFGVSYMNAMKAGQSQTYFPEKFDFDTFFIKAFGEKYQELNKEKKDEAKVHMGKMMNILHSAPQLVDLYKASDYQEIGVEKEADRTVFYFKHTMPNGNYEKSGISIVKIDDRLLINDLSHEGIWVSGQMKTGYERVKDEMTPIQLIKAMAEETENLFKQNGEGDK
jgi:hypothetical protein